MNITPLRLGVAGLGRGLMLTLPALCKSPKIKIAGAFDLRTDASRRFSEEFSAMTFPTYQALLASPEIDAVYIATPHELHADQTVQALNAGKHVLVEKPMATSIAQAMQMVEAAEKSGRTLLVGPSHGMATVRQGLSQ